MSSRISKGPVFKVDAEIHRRQYGLSRTEFRWPRLVVTDWERGPFKLERKQTYKDNENRNLSKIAWIVAVRLGRRQRVLAKYERALQAN